MRHLPVLSVAAVALLSVCACENAVPDEGAAMSAGIVDENEAAFTATCAGGPTVKGIDVSVYQAGIDWGAVAADGVRYAFIRVSDGAGVRDSRFDANWVGARQHGILRGAYQFFRSDEDPVAEANLLLQKIGGALAPGDLPPVIDVESTDGQSPGTVAAKVHAWLDTVEAALGVRPIVYTGPYFWRDQVGGADETRSPLFIAHYGTSCPFVPPHWATWTFHQYGSTGQVAGIGPRVDMDVFNGTEDELRALAAGASPLPEPPTGIVGGVSPNGSGYWLVGADGGVFSYGTSFFGSMGGQALARPVVGMSSTPSGHGYWLAAADGGVFTFGDAGFFGSMGGQPLAAPVVGMASTPSGQGYWLVAADGGIFTFGDARFFGSMGGQPLGKPVVGMAATPSGQGYWLVASDGGIFTFGDAGFFGSMGGQPLAKPVAGMASTPTGQGYWLVASDGGVFTFGDARFFGSMGGQPLAGAVTGIAATGDGGGYWLFARDGGVFTFGNAPFRGSDARP